MNDRALQRLRDKFERQPVHIVLLRRRRALEQKILLLLSLLLLACAIGFAVSSPRFDILGVFSMLAGFCVIPVWLHRLVAYLMASRREALTRLVWEDDEVWALERLGAYHTMQVDRDDEQRARRRRYNVYSKLCTMLIIAGIAGFLAVMSMIPPVITTWHIVGIFVLVGLIVLSCVGMMVFSSKHDRLLEDQNRLELEREIVREAASRAGNSHLGALSAPEDDARALRGALSTSSESSTYGHE